MSKKYLSLEETATSLGVSREELIRMREKGEIRGFADRGTWKFREEDVQQVRRSRQADSDPDVPMFVDNAEDDSAIMIGDEVSEQPTIIRKGGDDLSSSDSEVKLMGSIADDLPGMSSETEVRPVSLDSDSDVKLVGAETESGIINIALDADSKLGIGGSDSGKFDFTADPVAGDLDSDSDVALVSDSSGEIDMSAAGRQVIGSDSDVRLVTDDQRH